MAQGTAITVSTTLAAGQMASIAQLISAAQAQDGFSAFNEAALLHLRHDREGVHHILVSRLGELVGYAQLSCQDSASTGQLVVAPSERRSGIGSALLEKLISVAPSPLRIWAMGNSPPAIALAASSRLVPARELLIMTRPLTRPVPPAELPADIQIRTFVPGQDEDDWLAVNSRAFRSHPEQGGMTRADLADRMEEPWFDPAGFLVAVQDNTMIGFHWTKQHEHQLGEVYVLGVDPAAAGRGVARALLVGGLKYLRERGNMAVELYVEADHDRAIALYEGYGFTVTSRDVMYAEQERQTGSRPRVQSRSTQPGLGIAGELN